MRRAPRLACLILILVPCLGCDLGTKVLAGRHLSGSAPIELLAGTVRLDFAMNLGGFLGLGADTPPAVRFWVFLVGVGVMLVLLAAHLVLAGRLSRCWTVGAALVLAGGIGNLIDRLAFGAVRDFLNVGVGPVRTGVFNVADMAVTGGVLLLLLDVYRRRERVEEEGS